MFALHTLYVRLFCLLSLLLVLYEVERCTQQRSTLMSWPHLCTPHTSHTQSAAMLHNLSPYIRGRSWPFGSIQIGSIFLHIITNGNKKHDIMSHVRKSGSI